MGTDSATDGVPSETTTATTSTTGPSAETTAAMESSGSTTAGAVGPTTGDPDTSSASATSSGGSSDDTALDSTGEVVPLSDAGLVARYFLDEAASGSLPLLALDSADEPFPLPLEYVEDTMHYADSFGHRGLAFDVAGADDAARAPIAGSKFDGLDGATELTFELVVRLDDVVGSGSRLIHIGRADAGTATLSSTDPEWLQFVWNNTIVREWDYSAFSDGVAHVVHMIVDTGAGSDATRFRLLVDGSELTPIILAAVEPAEPASVPDDAFIALGNRDQDRAIEGILFYVAIYGVAISDDTVALHVPMLIEDDDSPR